MRLEGQKKDCHSSEHERGLRLLKSSRTAVLISWACT
jgi:hypothetical protein